jgi:DNA polymerase III delta subunit
MPELSPEKFLDRLASGKPVPAVVLLGTDAYLREKCRTKIVEACVPEGMRDWAVARFSASGGGWSDLFQRAQTMPMLAPRQVLVLEDAESVEKLGEKLREDFLESLEKYFDSPAPFTILVLEAAALDGRQKLYKLLAQKALLVDLSLGGQSAALFAEQMAEELGVQMDRPAAVLLADILNGEPARMRVELEKLAAYVHGRGRIAVADVEALVVAARKNTVWQLADMLAARKRDAALAFLDNLLREGEQPAGLVGVLAWMYRKLVEARDLPADTNPFQAARQLSMRPEAAGVALRNAQRIPKNELLAGLVALAEADSQLKSANPNPRAVLEFLIVRLTCAPAP